MQFILGLIQNHLWHWRDLYCDEIPHDTAWSWRNSAGQYQKLKQFWIVFVNPPITGEAQSLTPPPSCRSELVSKWLKFTRAWVETLHRLFFRISIKVLGVYILFLSCPNLQLWRHQGIYSSNVNGQKGFFETSWQILVYFRVLKSAKFLHKKQKWILVWKMNNRFRKDNVSQNNVLNMQECDSVLGALEKRYIYNFRAP